MKESYESPVKMCSDPPDLFTECITQPYYSAHPVHECRCPRCEYPVLMPVIVNRSFVDEATKILAHIMDKTGYTKELLAEIATTAIINMAEKGGSE